jgi:hypothetical protein
MTSLGEERVKVPAGEFVAARVEWDVAPGQTVTYWYARGVGLVRQDGTPNRTLESFTPGRE